MIAHRSQSMALIGFPHRSATEPSRDQSICFLAARATLQLSDKMALQYQVASFPTSALTNTCQAMQFSGLGPVVPWCFYRPHRTSYVAVMSVFIC